MAAESQCYRFSLSHCYRRALCCPRHGCQACGTLRGCGVASVLLWGAMPCDLHISQLVFCRGGVICKYRYHSGGQVGRQSTTFRDVCVSSPLFSVTLLLPLIVPSVRVCVPALRAKREYSKRLSSLGEEYTFMGSLTLWHRPPDDTSSGLCLSDSVYFSRSLCVCRICVCVANRRLLSPLSSV